MMNARRLNSAGVFLVLALSACGEMAVDSETEATSDALITDNWQGVFAVRSPSVSNFIVNPIGSPVISCPNGTAASECSVSRINLARMGLTTTQQSTILSRLRLEPASESRISVLMKGALVLVRDTRVYPTQSYWEFRAQRIHLASSVRDHGSFTGYIAGPAQNGFYPVKMLNSDMLPRAVDITYAARLRWVGPIPAPTYSPDRFISVSAVRNAAGSSTIGLGPYEFDVNQIFNPYP